MAGDKRSYSDHEASLILRRAGELAVNDNAGDARRLSLGELEAAAEEAGIDRALVRRAASELRSSAAVTPPDNVFLGGPSMIVLEAVVDGMVSSAAHEHIVNTARRLIGDQGTHDVLGATLTWAVVPRSNQLGRNVMVTITPRDGVTTIRIEERLGQLAGGLFGGVLGGVGGGGMGLFIGPLIIAGVPGLIPIALVAWLGGVWGVTRKIYASKTRARQADGRALLRALVEIAEDNIASAG